MRRPGKSQTAADYLFDKIENDRVGWIGARPRALLGKRWPSLRCWRGFLESSPRRQCATRREGLHKNVEERRTISETQRFPEQIAPDSGPAADHLLEGLSNTGPGVAGDACSTPAARRRRRPSVRSDWYLDQALRAAVVPTWSSSRIFANGYCPRLPHLGQTSRIIVNLAAACLSE
jgi:hypothetical protein